MYYHIRFETKERGIEDVLNIKVPTVQMNIQWVMRTKTIQKITILTSENKINKFEDIKEIKK